VTHFVTHFVDSYGLIALFVLVMLESSGVPVPGETALITAALLAAHGSLDIAAVIVVAATAAIVGDNIGYVLARVGGKRLLMRWSFIARHAEKAIPKGERFFEKHGGKTVFLARFVIGLRVFGAWVAGISKMPWPRFLFWNAAGGICWAIAIGLATYYLGKHVVEAVGSYGAIAVVAVIALAVLGFLLWRRRSRVRS